MAMAHVLVVPYPSQGHMNPMVQFARKLASKGGIAVTVVTTRFIARSTTSSGGVDAGPGVRVEAISDGHDEGGVAAASSLEAYLAALDAAGAASLAALVAAAEEASAFTCVVYDTFAPWAGRVARRAGLPALAFSTQSCAVSAVYHYVHEGKLAVPPRAEAEAEAAEIVRSAAMAGLPEMERWELPSFVLDDGPYPTLAVFAVGQFADTGKDDWVLFNSFDELESEVLAGLSTQWRARAIGPCVPLPAAGAGDAVTGGLTYGANLLDPEDTCMQWLDAKPPRSVAYVSFGSFASLGAAQTEELARGLLSAGKPFLWVVRVTEEPQLPRHLLDAAAASGDALVVRWSPQLDVLAHRTTGCFVTHCGWNSTLEALGFGVPMVALPVWTDQPTNALLVDRAWGAGVRARRDDAAGMFLRGEIERCVRAVMDGGEEEEEEEEQGSAAARVRREARRWSGVARAAVSPGGSSDRSLDEFVEFLRGGAGAGEKWKALVREGSEAAASEM